MGKFGGDYGGKKCRAEIAIISGTAKAMNFKFGGYIHRVHPDTSPLKIWEKREHGRIQGLPKFFRCKLR